MAGFGAPISGRFCAPNDKQTQQQTGEPFIIMHTVQPGIIMPVMQSQQLWIILAHIGSPLVQVMQTPISIDSTLHVPIIMLQLHTIIPFIMTQQPHIPPAIIMHRF